jgi:hypothetical protein
VQSVKKQLIGASGHAMGPFRIFFRDTAAKI